MISTKFHSTSTAVVALILIAATITPISFVECFQLHHTTLSAGRSSMKSNIRLYSENPNKGSDFPKEEEVMGEKYEGMILYYLLVIAFLLYIYMFSQHTYITTTLSNVGSVDWDAEWKKVIEDRDQPKQRPGQYKSQVEIEAIKATNKVAKNVFQASQEVKSNTVQNWSSLKGDWKFWIGILVIVSFGLSILTATSVQPANESFYI